MDTIYNLQPTPETPEEIAADDEAATQERIRLMRSVAPKSPKCSRRRLLAVVAVLLLVAGAGLGWHLSRTKTSSSRAAKAPLSTVSRGSSSVAGKSTPAVPTQAYASPDFNLNFNYPDGWKVVDSGNGPLTVASPGMRLTAATGQTVTGEIIMTIQQKGQLPASFSAGTALAVLDSQKVNYTQATPAQQDQTYLSFVQYASTTVPGGLDGIYVTGSDGYQKDQVIPAADIATIDPLVTVTFTQCGNAACTVNLTPLTITSASWNSSAFKAPILALLTSLAFQ